MRVNEPRGLTTLISFGPRIRQSVQAQPDGLLLHENLLFSLFPPQAGMRQYWRDFDSLERLARALPHPRGGEAVLRARGGPRLLHPNPLPGGAEAEGVHRQPPAGPAHLPP